MTTQHEQPEHLNDNSGEQPSSSNSDTKTARNSLSSKFSALASRVIPKRSTLSNIFKPASLGAIGGAAAKGVAVAAGTATLGPVFALAAAGVFMGVTLFKDMKKREEHETKRDVLKKNYKKYLIKTLATGAGAAIGYFGADEIISALDSTGSDIDIAAPAPDADIANIPDEIKTEAIEEIKEIGSLETEITDETLSISPEETDPELKAEPAADIETDTELELELELEVEAEPEAEPQPVEPEIIIPDDAYARLEMLAEQDGLSEQAQSIIDAALKGQDWAIRDAGLGLLNGQYGFDQLGEMTGHVDADSWGAELLRDAAETGDAKAQMDLAYFEYTGINDAIAVDKEAALEVIKAQDDIWYNGESLLHELKLGEAKADFLAQMPEGTDINDYNISLSDDGGYHFEPKDFTMDQEQADSLRQAGLDPESCELKEHNKQELIWQNCEPAIN